MGWTEEPLDQRNVVALVHSIVEAESLGDGLAIDATAGNGHDTLFLAQQVGPGGRVLSVDIQPEAARATTERLEASGLLERVLVTCADHQDLPQLTPEEWRGSVSAILFNLGYLPGFLPGGERVQLTRARSSVAAAEAALGLLAPGGLLVIAIYTGHAQGPAECRALEIWARGVESCETLHVRDRGPDAKGRPEILIMRRA